MASIEEFGKLWKAKRGKEKHMNDTHRKQLGQTVWLSQREMAQLFDVSADNVGLHLKNIFAEEELEGKAVTEESSVTAADGKNYLTKLYNLDAILAVGYRVRSKRGVQFRADIALAFEQAVVGTLIIKCRRALHATGHRHLVLAGGVSANQRLRQGMAEAMAKAGITTHYPRLAFCTDNAAMIAYAGWQRLRLGESEPLSFKAKPRWAI